MFKYCFSFLILYVVCLSAISLNNSNKRLSSSHRSKASCPIKSTSAAVLKSTLNCIKAIIPRSKIIESSSSSYANFNYQFIKYKPKTPKAYILVNSVAHVQTIVRCAKSNNYPISVRSGGHSYEKYSYGDSNSIVIDLRGLKTVLVDVAGKTATVGAGAYLGEIYYQLWNNGKFGISGGSCPLVGISGFTLGGGYGVSSRKYGLLIDNVLEFQMVNYKGEFFIANENSNADLYWALRGAGQGSFGIVTQFKFKIFDASKQVTILEKAYSENFELGFTKFQNWVLSNPSKSVMGMVYANPSEGAFVISFVIQPDSETERVSIINSINSYFTQAVTASRKDMTFIDMVLFYGGLSGKGVKTPSDLLKINSKMMDRSYFHAKSHFIKKTLTSTEISDFTKQFNTLSTGYILLNQCGGAISEVSPTTTAYVHRNNILYGIQSIHDSTSISDKTLLNNFDKNTAFAYSDESYQNYIDEDMANPLQKYYGQNLARLIAIKKIYDPENFWCFAMSIPLS